MSSTERSDYLDAMRATLMMLGIALHAAQIYNPNDVWLVDSQDTSPFFYYFLRAINTFRMPAFFFLSGFLSMMLVTRRGTGDFFRSRMKRIALPLVVTALTLNVLQTWILLRTGWLDTTLLAYYLSGEWVQHLWFLIALLVYLWLLTGLSALPRTAVWMQWLATQLSRVPVWLLLGTLPLTAIVMMSLDKTGFPVYDKWLGIIAPYTLFQYLPFFVLGCLAYWNQTLFHKFTSQHGVLLLLCVGIAAAATFYVGTRADSFGQRLAGVYLDFLMNWLCVCLCFSVFRILVRQMTPAWRYLSEASYTIYLFHHIIVVCLGIVFVYLAVPAALGFVVIVPVTLALTLLLHRYLITRYQPLSVLFNGKDKPARAQGTSGVRSAQGSGLKGTDDRDSVSEPA